MLYKIYCLNPRFSPLAPQLCTSNLYHKFWFNSVSILQLLACFSSQDSSFCDHHSHHGTYLQCLLNSSRLTSVRSSYVNPTNLVQSEEPLKHEASQFQTSGTTTSYQWPMWASKLINFVKGYVTGLVRVP